MFSSVSPAEAQLLSLLRELGIPLTEQDRSATSRKKAGKISLLPLFQTTLQDYNIYSGGTSLFSSSSSSSPFSHHHADALSRVPSATTGIRSASTAKTGLHSKGPIDQPVFSHSPFLTEPKAVAKVCKKANRKEQHHGTDSDADSHGSNDGAGGGASKSNATTKRRDDDLVDSDDETETGDEDSSSSSPSSSDDDDDDDDDGEDGENDDDDDDGNGNNLHDEESKKFFHKLNSAAAARALKREQLKRPLIPVAAFAINPWMGAAATMMLSSATTTTSSSSASSIANGIVLNGNSDEPLLNQLTFLAATLPAGGLSTTSTAHSANASNTNNNSNNSNNPSTADGASAASASRLLLAPETWTSSVPVPLSIVQESTMRMNRSAQQLFSVIEDSEKFSRLLSIVGSVEQDEETKAANILELMGFPTARLRHRDQAHDDHHQGQSLDTSTKNNEGKNTKSNEDSFYAELFGDDDNSRVARRGEGDDKHEEKSSKDNSSQDDDDDDDDGGGDENHVAAGFVAVPKSKQQKLSSVNQKAKAPQNRQKKQGAAAATQAIKDAFDQWNNATTAAINQNQNQAEFKHSSSNNPLTGKDEVQARDFLERARRREYEEQLKLLRKDDQQQDRRRRQRDDPR